MILAVIPARGGSKRLPGKNVRLFCGKPMLQYSIDAALHSGAFDRVIVTTDCQQIADLATQLGAEVPFLRPAELADDHTPTIPVIRHAVEAVQATGDAVDVACCIYATAPFISVDVLRQGLELLRADPEAQFAFPITTFPSSIFRSLQRKGDRVEMFYPQHELTRSQDLPEAYHDAGQFYWGTATAWLGETGIYSARSIGIPIPRQDVQDIDTAEDWAMAESMFQTRREEKA